MIGNSNLHSIKNSSNFNNNNNSIKNFNFNEDSKISLIVNVVNTSPNHSMNKNLGSSSITPPPEIENTEKINEKNKIREFNTKPKAENFNALSNDNLGNTQSQSIGNNISNSNKSITKPNKSPYNKDKFIKHIKANNYNNNCRNYDNINAKSLSIVSENTGLKGKIFQNNFLIQSKVGNTNFPIKESYKSENDFGNNLNNLNRTKTPNSRSLNRDLSENVIYSNKLYYKNNINYTNRENSQSLLQNVLSDRDKKSPNNPNNKRVFNNQNLNFSQNNSNNLSGFTYKNNSNNNSDNKRNSNNSKHPSNSLSYSGGYQKNNTYNNNQQENKLNFQNTSKNTVGNVTISTSNNNNSGNNNTAATLTAGFYQIKQNSIYSNPILQKSLNSNSNHIINNSINISNIAIPPSSNSKEYLI